MQDISASFKLKSLLSVGECEANPQHIDYINRVLDFPLSGEQFFPLKSIIKSIDVSDNFIEIIDYFKVPLGITPAGFKITYLVDAHQTLIVDLVRDIAYGENGVLRPTNLLFSADSANPYEIEPIKDLIANLTCNPGIIYDLFINNPKANIGNKFTTRDEVMEEIGRILGPGVDISVELNDPFNSSDEEILEEVRKFEVMLSKYRLVVKVPHTGPVNAENVKELLEGDKKFSKRYTEVTTKDAFRGHRIALMLQQRGYRVNFTLMFDPYQTNLALLAKPYFINSFIRHRMMQSDEMTKLLDAYQVTKDKNYLVKLRTFLIDKDYLAGKDSQMELLDIMQLAQQLVDYRHYRDLEGNDGLDSVRHNLRLLKNCNLPDTRLIICSMEGELNYPAIDKLLTEPEFITMNHKVVLTAEPVYLARFTSTSQVIAYQRRFMNAAAGQK